jgi:hypothetical protein
MASPLVTIPPLVIPRVQRAKGPKSTDGVAPQFLRVGQLGEQYSLSLFPTKHLLADEGSQFYATNPTIGTAVTYAITASFSATTPAFAIKNNDVPGGNYKRVYLDFVRIAFTGTGATVPASAIGAQLAVVLDNINRAPTAGNVAITPQNTNMDDTSGTIATVQAFSSGNLTVPAAGPSARTVARAWLRHVIPVTQDELLCFFGGIEGGGGVIGSTAGRVVSACPAVVIGPQQWALIYIWFPSNATTAGVFEYDLGWVER